MEQLKVLLFQFGDLQFAGFLPNLIHIVHKSFPLLAVLEPSSSLFLQVLPKLLQEIKLHIRQLPKSVAIFIGKRGLGVEGGEQGILFAVGVGGEGLLFGLEAVPIANHFFHKILVVPPGLDYPVVDGLDLLLLLFDAVFLFLRGRLHPYHVFLHILNPHLLQLQNVP